MSTFKQLAIGDVFVFASEDDPKFRFSGMARGPWRKSSARLYKHVETNRQHEVGKMSTKVRKVEE